MTRGPPQKAFADLLDHMVTHDGLTDDMIPMIRRYGGTVIDRLQIERDGGPPVARPSPARRSRKFATTLLMAIIAARRRVHVRRRSVETCSSLAGLQEMNERDVQLLAILDRDDRSKIEEVVDEIIQESLPSSEPAFLHAAASSFDERAEALPEIDKLVAWQIAAALRARTTPGFRLH